MKTFKKVLSINLLGALIASWMILLVPNQVQAACTWSEEKTFYVNNKVQVKGGCSNTQDESDDSSCTAKKPTYTQSGGVARVAVCCCDKNASPQQASSNVCSWEKQKTYYDTAKRQNITTDCSSGKSVFNDNNCTGTKPNYPPENGVGVKAVCCCQSNTIANPVSATSEPKYKIPEMQVEIPDLTFSDVTCSNQAGGGFVCSIPWIGDYIGGVYQYALGIGGVLAAVMLMAGGLLWLISAGDATKISKAKTLITGSISGLVILFASYTLLYQINPELTAFTPIKIRNIDKVNLTYQGGDSDVNNITGSCFSDSELVSIRGIDNVTISPVCSDPRLSKASYDALKKAGETAKTLGFGLTITSANRTYQAQLAIWNEKLKKYGTPEATRLYVADPENCKPPTCVNHCGAVAVDLCITGTPDCSKMNGANAKMVNENTKKLEAVMNSAGWGRYCGEWWHFQTNRPAVPCS